MVTMTRTVLIIDDHPMWRDAVRAVLDSTGRYSISATATTVAEAKQALSSAEHFDLVLVDMTLPDGNGIEIVKLIGSTMPQTAAVLVTADKRTQVARKALREGARGYIPKSTPANQMLSLLDSVSSGGIGMTIEDATSVMSEQDPLGEDLGKSLTPKQMEVLLLLCSGMTATDALARHLGVSEGTVKTHLTKLYLVMGVDDRAAVVAAAFRAGLVS